MSIMIGSRMPVWASTYIRLWFNMLASHALCTDPVLLVPIIWVYMRDAPLVCLTLWYVIVGLWVSVSETALRTDIIFDGSCTRQPRPTGDIILTYKYARTEPAQFQCGTVSYKPDPKTIGSSYRSLQTYGVLISGRQLILCSEICTAPVSFCCSSSCAVRFHSSPWDAAIPSQYKDFFLRKYVALLGL